MIVHTRRKAVRHFAHFLSLPHSNTFSSTQPPADQKENEPIGLQLLFCPCTHLRPCTAGYVGAASNESCGLVCERGRGRGEVRFGEGAVGRGGREGEQ